MSEQIRVIVANRPRLMRELVLETIVAQHDIEIIAEIENEAEIAEVVGSTYPDFLIIALDEANVRPPLCDALLRLYPSIKILALAPDGNSSTLFWASIEIHSIPVEASEAGILRTLRGQSQYVT